MAVSQKAVAGQPIKNAAVVFMTQAQVPQELRNRLTLPDSHLTDLDNYLYDVGRNRFYYTTGDEDPPDPA